MITTEMQGGLARIILHRVETRNSFGIADWSALRDVTQILASSSARVVLVESALSGNFCAGSDIKAMVDLRDNPTAVAHFREVMRAALEGLAQLPMPTIANIQGHCFGAGVALALACDMRIAGPQAQFGITPAKLGIVYPYEDIARLVHLIGRGQTSRLLLSAATIDAAEALRIGLVEMEGGPEAAAVLAQQILKNAPRSLASLKAMIQTPHPHSTHDGLFDRFFSEAAFAEGLAAFAQKRAPQFDDR